jgi:hypothetical protein
MATRADKYDDLIQSFRRVEDGGGQFVHYPNWKPGDKSGSSAFGSFGFTPKGHLSTAFNSTQFEKIKKQNPNYKAYFKELRASGYDNAKLKEAERAYSEWLYEETGGDVKKAANFNLTGNTAGVFQGTDGNNNMSATAYANKVAGLSPTGLQNTRSSRENLNYIKTNPIDVSASMSKGSAKVVGATRNTMHYPSAREYMKRDPSKTGLSAADIAGTSDWAKAEMKKVNAPVLGKTPDLQSGREDPVNYDQRASVGETVLPFASNLANAFRKPPTVPIPNMQSGVSLDRVDMSDDRNQIGHGVRAAYESNKTLLDPNSAAAANSYILAQRFKQMSQVNQTERNTNIGIANQEKLTNLSIQNQNMAKLDQVQRDNVERTLAQQREQSANLSNAGDKAMMMLQNKQARNLEADKLRYLQTVDPYGTTTRSLRESDLTEEEKYKRYNKFLEFEKANKTKKYGGILARKLNYKAIR